jgi:hypothetical protein
VEQLGGHLRKQCLSPRATPRAFTPIEAKRLKPKAWGRGGKPGAEACGAQRGNAAQGASNPLPQRSLLGCRYGRGQPRPWEPRPCIDPGSENMLDIFGGNYTRQTRRRYVGPWDPWGSRRGTTLFVDLRAAVQLSKQPQQTTCVGFLRICDQRHSSPQPQPQLVHEFYHS